MGEDFFIFSIKIFGRRIDIRTDGNDGCAMFYLFDPTLGFQRGDEVSHITGDIRNGGFMEHMYQGVVIDRAYQILQIGLNIHSLQGGVNPSRHSPQFLIFFYQMNFMSLVCYGERTGHAGDAAAHYQCRLVYRQIKFLQWLQIAGSCYRHADDILCLPGGLFLFLGMDPGAVLPDIGHFTVILIKTRLTKGVTEQRFKCPGGAGGDNHSIEPFFLCRFGYFLGGIRSTGKQLFLSIDNIGQGQGIIHRGRNIHYSSDIRPTMAHKDAYLWLLPGDIPFRRVHPFFGQLPSSVVKELAALGPGRTGGKHRLGDIRRALEGAAYKDSGPGSLHGIGKRCLTEPVGIELDSEHIRHCLITAGRIQSNG